MCSAENLCSTMTAISYNGIILLCLIFCLHKKETYQAEDIIAELDYFCKMQPDQRPCTHGSRKIMWYYNVRFKGCLTYVDYRCGRSDNNAYSSEKECYDTCRDAGQRIVDPDVPASVYCRLQPDVGTCSKYEPAFYYNVSSGRCQGFAYTGCSGNFNRFENDQLCMNKCSAYSIIIQ